MHSRVKNERDEALDGKIAAEKERDTALRRLECFACFGHENALHVFIPCGHMICSACRDTAAVDTPCPKCQATIMGRVKIYN
jgi:late competence protein required for DNA uptake (superfamily II DNA/RNA helicase)